MSSPNPSHRLRHVAETALFAAAGGILLGALKFPAGFLSGAILFVATAALCGRPMTVPPRIARVFFVLLGTSIGAVVTPQTVAGVVNYPASILLVTLSMTCITSSNVIYLRRLHGWDLQTSVLAAIPGGLSQVLAVAADQHVDLRAIAMVQTMRVAILAVGIPICMQVFGLITAPPVLPAGADFSTGALTELAILLGCSTVAALVTFRLGFPGGMIFGPMLTSGFLHGGGFVHVALPWWVADTSMIALGAFSGSRFANTDVRLLMRFASAAVGSFVIGMGVATAFALAVTAFLPVRLSDAIIAYAPGSIDAMMILALALHLDPIFVGSHHLARVFVLSMSLPLVARWAAGRDRGKPGSGSRAPKSKRPETFQD